MHFSTEINYTTCYFCRTTSPGELYRYTPDAIAHLEHLFRSTLTSIELVNGQIKTGLKQTVVIFRDFQKKLDDVLVNLRLPVSLLSRSGLTDFIVRLAPLFDEHRHDDLIINSSAGESSTSLLLHIDPKESRKKMMQSKIDATITNITNLRSRAGQLPLRPHHIIQRIHTTLYKLQTFDIDQESEASYKWLLSEEKTLSGLLDSFTVSINQYTTFHAPLPNDRLIHELKEKEFQFTIPSMHSTNYRSDLKVYCEKIQNSSQDHSFSELSEIIRLTDAQVSNQTWIRAICLLVSNEKDPLRATLMVLNDDLAMQLERNSINETNDATFEDNVIFAYAQYRCGLLNEESNRNMLSNYTKVARLSTELREWTRKSHLNVFNMLENIKKIHDDLNLAQNQTKNFPTDSSYNLLPVDIRPEDLICLLAPEHTSIIQIVCSKFNDIDLFLSCRIDKIEPMHLSSVTPSITATNGLASYIYRRGTTMTSLFDKQKHIHYIVNATINVIQQLMDICIDPKIQACLLMKICTSVKELFPIHIALSLTLMVLIDWAAINLADFKQHQHLLALTTLKADENELLELKITLHQMKQELNKIQQDFEKLHREREDAELELHFATNTERFLVGELTEKVHSCYQREQVAETTMKKNQDEILKTKQHLEELTNSYRYKLEQKQEQWMANILNHFSKVSQLINIFVLDLAKESGLNLSPSSDLLALLTVPATIARQNLLEPARIIFDHTRIESFSANISEALKDVRTHGLALVETDPMHLFISFYCDIIRMSLSSFMNSTISWKHYSKIPQTAEMEFYGENKKKQNLCQLNSWTREQCSLFLDQIRTGCEQHEIIKHAETISKYVRSESIKLDVLMTGQYNKQFQYLIREFERFVVNLLIVGCRYLQLQRGIREPLDDLLVGITTELVDPNLPRREIDLLSLLDRCEMQLKSHSDSLLFLPLHLVFTFNSNPFNSNPFNLFDQLERSVKALIQLVLPAAYMIKRTWSTIDQLIEKISDALTVDEYVIIDKICKNFLELTDEANEIDDKGDFISKRLRSDLFELISKHIDDLCKILPRYRSNMKLFCEDLYQRWHLTMTEMFRGFIKAKKFHLHRQLTWNRRKVKQINNTLFTSDLDGNLRLADIERVLQRKLHLLELISSDRRSKYLLQLNYLQIIYQLTIGGTDNLELILMNMPMEHMDYTVFFKLLKSTRELYDNSEKLLLEESLIKLITDENQIDDAFKLLEDIYRLEYRIFHDFYSLFKEQVQNSYKCLVDSTDFQSLVKQAVQANEQWLSAGNDFVKLRRRIRTKNEHFSEQVARKLHSWGQSLVSFFRPNSTTSSHQHIDHYFATLLQEVVWSMQSQQYGNRQIFIVAEQDQLQKTIDLHQQYRRLLNLEPLHNQLFSKSESIFQLHIERTNWQLQEISILFWDKRDNKNPVGSLKVLLNSQFTELPIVVKTQIKNLAVYTEHISGKRMTWSILVDSQKQYRIGKELKLTCKKMYSKYYYVVNGVKDELSRSSPIQSVSELQNSLHELKEEILAQCQQNKEEEQLRLSPTTQTLLKLSNDLENIISVIRCPEVDSNHLTTTSDIYHIFEQLPQVDKLKKALDQLSIETFGSISPLTHIVNDDDPAIHIDFSSVQTNSMNQAFLLGRKSLLDAIGQLYHFINYLQLNKTHMALAYTWANALLTSGSSDTQQEFSSILMECDRFREISMENTLENVQRLNECQHVIKDAKRIYGTIKRASNNWTEIKRLINLSPLPIEDDLNKAFLHSKMSRDAHLWLIEAKGNNKKSTNLTCYPQTAVVDFGITLSSIHQRLTQRVFIHNHTDRDLRVKIDRIVSDDAVFHVIGENLQVAAGHMCEFEIFLRPPSTIGSLHEKWNLLIDNKITLSNVIRPQTQIVDIDVEQSATTIDFGLVACLNHRIEKTIELKNVLPCSVRIKSQLQTTEISKQQSHLIILNQEFELAAESTLPFGIALDATDYAEEDIDADVCLAIDSAKNLKWIKVLAQVRQTHLAVTYQGRTYLEKVPSDRVSIHDLYKAEKRLISIEFRNDGPIEYTLRLSSEKLKIDVSELNLPVNITKIVVIEIQMSTSAREVFVLSIDFLNNKRQCQLTFDCQTAEPRLNHSTSASDRKRIIEIATSAQMEKIWNKDLQLLLPIEQNITFTNESKAAATISYGGIVSPIDSKHLNVQFHIEPNPLVIQPKSEESVRFLYHPTDLRRIDAQVQLQTNTSTDPISIPYSLEFHTPILQTMSPTVIDIGLIQSGKSFTGNDLIIKNIGQKELRFAISESCRQKSFVKVALLQESSTCTTTTSIHHPLKIKPNQQRSFKVTIECEKIDDNTIPEIIGLVEFELTSLCDPVINTDGTLVNRTVTITIIGRTQPVKDYTLPTELNPRFWSDLELLPSSWLYQICREHAVHTSYTPLVMLTAIAHVCGSPETKNSLPTTKEGWSTFCTNLHLDRNKHNTKRLTIDQFANETTVSTATDTLIKLLRSSLTNYRSYFHHSSVFHRSFTHHESIRLQLYAVINSSTNTDEVYAMQSYASKFWEIYEQSTPDDVYRQAIEFLHQCLSNDCAMPESIRTFTKFIHQIVRSSSPDQVAQDLSKLIPSTSSFGELITVSTNPSDLKWTLLLTHVNGHTKEIMIRLVKNDWQALLDLHLTAIRQQNTISLQRVLLEAVENMHSLWSTFDSNRKSDILTSLFADYKELILILQQISDKRSARLDDLMRVTEMIFTRFEPLTLFYYIRDAFKRFTYPSISYPSISYSSISYPSISYSSISYPNITDTLRDIAYLPKPVPYQLVSKISEFRQKLTGDYSNPTICVDHIKLFCDILSQLVQLTATQWTSARKAIELAYRLLCVASEKDLTLAVVVGQSLLLLDVLQPDKNWNSIRESYRRLHSTPTWENMLKYIDLLGCNKEIVQITGDLIDANREETMMEIIFKLCRLISTNDELALLNKHESSIQQLSTNISSVIGFFEQAQSFTPPAIQQKMHCFLTLLRLSSLSELDDDSKYLTFDSISQSWLTLFDITCTKSHRLFAVISSILTSFPGLLVTRGNPLGQQLYTSSLASALCILAQCRQNTREGYITTPTIVSGTTLSSILVSIRENLAKRTSGHEITPPGAHQPKSNASSPSSLVPRPKLTRMPSVACPYSDETLTKMETSVVNYVENLSRSSILFAESNTIHDIVKAAVNTRTQVTQWYANFTTFNVLVHYRFNSNNSNHIQIGHGIVQYGLQLLRDLVIVRKILEPTFAHVGILFLLKELNQLEKSLLSLALEQYPVMRNTLRQLNVDISRIKLDFKLPSHSVVPKGRSSNRPKLDILTQINVPPESVGQTDGSTPSIGNIDTDAPISLDDWENAMRTNNNQQFYDDMEKLAKKKQEMKSKNTNKRMPNRDLESSVRNLASDMLNQNTNNNNVFPTSTAMGQNDPILDDNTGGQEINIDLGMKAMQEQLQQQPNLIEMYEKAGEKNMSLTVPDGKLDNRSALKPPDKQERWTYQMLVETPPIAQMIDRIVQEFRSQWEKLVNSMGLMDEHQIRWCILIDNSGSMSIHRNAIYEALVVIMELLRKLESKFAIGRFGTRTNQKILKNLDDLFTNQDGQYVLEALTFDEGTYPATGLTRIADRVFPAGGSSNITTHRLVLMITDGLTQERDEATYSAAISKYTINLGVMFIETADQNSSQLLLRGLKQAQSCVLKANKIDELPLKVPQLMHEMIRACLTRTSTPPTTTISPVINVHVPENKEFSLLPEIPDEKQKYTAVSQTSYTVSIPTARIPKLSEIRSQLINYLSRSDEYTDYASHAVHKLREYYHSLKPTSTMQAIEKKWIRDEYHFSGLVDDLSTVLSDVVFPLNKFTRRRAALRGSSLYLPGLIKAMTTEWSYKKIFSAKLAGGKRDHAVCLVLDISTSMFGTLGIGMLDAIVVLIAALRKLNLENFGIIVFGRNVRLIKTNEQPWDALCICTLMQELRFDRDDDTKDAHAIEAAIDLLGQCSIRGEKKIFILTDGYTSCGSRLSMVQQRAEDSGIDLVAMTFGIDQTNLISVYKRYLQCATPYGLPKALRTLYEQETQLYSLDWPPNINAEPNITDSTITKDTLFDDIKSKKIFGEMIKDLTGQRELMLINSGQPPSNMTVDICFCLDCTGSMSRWLSAAREQMKLIIEGITNVIKKEYPSLKLQLRFAIVGYRDIGDKPQFISQDFTDKTEESISFLNKLTASGGDDLAEDVLGALDKCLNLTWSKTNARFIVLITDAPGHGPDLNDNPDIDKHPNGVKDHTVKSICDRLLKKDGEIDLMFCCIKPKATAKMQQTFAQYYNDRKDETGKAFTTIKLFDDKQLETQSFHFVFVLDESGSMTEEWNALQKAYLGFLTRRNDDQGGDDLFTVIQFASNAHIVCQEQRLANTPRALIMRGGGTDYCSGLTKAKEAITADRTASSIVMIFMSDGGDGSVGDPSALVRQFKQNYAANHNFICHTIGFGSGVAQGSSEAQLLANMASIGGGRAYSALTGAELQTVFNNIAANSTTSDALVERFSLILAREISTKIMVDYL